MTPKQRIEQAINKPVEERSQTEKVMLNLYLYGWISTIHAVRTMYILRLAARISQLKDMGFHIENTEGQGNLAIYRLDTDQWEQLRNEVDV